MSRSEPLHAAPAAVQESAPNLGIQPREFLQTLSPATDAPARATGDTIIQLRPPRDLRPLSAQAAVTDELGLGEGEKLFKIRFADSDGRRRSASFLIQKRYSARGYNTSAGHERGSDRVTFCAFDGASVIATISVGTDLGAGLFVDAVFGRELAGLRSSGSRICEFTKLAIDETIRSRSLLAALFHTAYVYARKVRQCTDLVAEVNPRHVKFYERMLGFAPLGASRMDPRVQAAASLLHLSLDHAESQIRRFGDKPVLAATVRSLYPLFFSADHEGAMQARLQRFA